jgi:hypothetical protein
MEGEEGVWQNNKGLLIAGAVAVIGAVASATWLLTRGKTGKGVKKFPTGETYEGDLVRGKATGYGISRTAAGDAVTGYWWVAFCRQTSTLLQLNRAHRKDDMPCGKCSGVFAAGHTFEGEAFDATHWKGTFRYPEKGEMEFDGAVDLGASGLTGQVVLRTGDGVEVFRGAFVNNLADGDDCRQVDNDGTYEGAMRKGQREGRGKLTGVTGHTYEGQWKSGAKHGEGVMKYADGQEYSGTWRQGQWQDGLLRRPDGRVDTVLAGNILNES